jgi:hypothetical protein
MPQNLKQFNFKLPEPLWNQLDELAKTKGITKTELVIQGILQILGLTSERSQGSNVDSDIYKQLDRLEQHFQEFVDYQSAVDLEMNKRIKTLEEVVKELQSQLSILDIANSVVKMSTEKTFAPNQDVVDNIALNLDIEEAESLSSPDIDKDIATRIDTKLDQVSTEKLVPKVSGVAPEQGRDIKASTKKAQLSLPLDQSNKELAGKVQTVSSTELIRVLQEVDPEREWNSDKLTNLRRSKKFQGNWHTVGNYKFQYAGENKEGARLSKHSWQLILPNEEKI